MPRLCRFVRRRQNRVDSFIHRYYGIFNNKLVSDSVYVLMKPLEWCFLIALYLFDTRPENRIALQYTDRKEFGKFSNGHFTAAQTKRSKN